MGKRGLTPEVLARAALAIVDAEGLPKLSMRRLAHELGVDPMAAYRHVPNKQALLDAVIDAQLAEVDLRDLPGRWEDRLREGVRRVFAAMTAHPNATPLLSARKWFTPHGMAITEWGMRELTGAGIDPHRAVLVMNATGLFLIGLAQAVAGTDGEDPETLLRALDPVSYPVTLAALAGGQGLRGYDELLEFWLDTVLLGLRAGA